MMKSTLSERLISITALLAMGVIFATVGLASPVQAAEGDVSITPSNQNVGPDESFDIEIIIDTGAKTLGAFNIQLNFDQTKMTIDTTVGEAPAEDSGRGFMKGADASNYNMLSNSGDIANGHLRVAGIAAEGGTSGSTQHVVIVKAKSLASFTTGTGELSVVVNELSDELGHIFAGGTATGGDVTAGNSQRGDVNGSGSITMGDAALVARFVTGLSVANWVAGSITGDVNCSGAVTMGDAALIARHVTGLSATGWCVN